MDDFDLLLPSSGNTSGYDYLDYSTGSDSLDMMINMFIKFISEHYLIILILFLIIQLFYGLMLRRYFRKINHTQGIWKSYFPFIRYLDFYRLSNTNQLFAFLIIGFIIPILNIVVIPLYYIMLNYAIFKTITKYQDSNYAIKTVLCNIFIPLGLPIYLMKMVNKVETLELEKGLNIQDKEPVFKVEEKVEKTEEYDIVVES